MDSNEEHFCHRCFLEFAIKYKKSNVIEATAGKEGISHGRNYLFKARLLWMVKSKRGEERV